MRSQAGLMVTKVPTVGSTRTRIEADRERLVVKGQDVVTSIVVTRRGVLQYVTLGVSVCLGQRVCSTRCQG